MRAIIQRCLSASVEVDGSITGQIGRGLVVFLGVATDDDASCANRIAAKIERLRIFDDADGRFNLSLRDIRGAALVISNFTVYGDARKGTRPSFTAAAPPEPAQRLYERFVAQLRGLDLPVETGIFAAHMHVQVHNDGPVTLILDVDPR